MNYYYAPQSWADNPSGGTPITAFRLGHMEKGIALIRGNDPRAADPNLDLTGVTDVASTIQGALAFGDVVLPHGTFKCNSDLNITVGGSSLYGMGDTTFLDFNGAGLIIQGTTGLTAEVQIQDLSLRRTGTAGAAIRFKGAGTSGGVAHVGMSNVRVRSSTGDGFYADGAYIATFTNCYFMGATGYGIKVALDTINATTYANNMTFIGGEVSSNAKAMYLDHTVNFSFYGTAIEGNTTSGVEVESGSYSVLFDNCYFEDNTAFDIKIGASGLVYGILVRGGYFADTTSAKAHSIQVERGRGLLFDSVTFLGYTAEPIWVNEDFVATVWGEVRNCTTSGNRTGLVLLSSGATEFNKFFLDKIVTNNLVAAQRTIASSTTAGTTGEICWDTSFIYVCIATNTWRRIAIPSTTW